jgi:hypothetical protein
MKTNVCVIGTVLALALSAPAAAQDAVETDAGVWAPWATTSTQAPAAQPRPRASVAVTRVVAEAAVAQPEAPRFHLERIWVVGSFR